MNRGRKPNNSSYNSDPTNIFQESVGSYFQIILSSLGRSNSLNSTDSSSNLLKEIRAISKVTFPEMNMAEIPYIIPKNWVWCRLGEVVKWADNFNIHSHLNSNEIINYVDIDSIDNKNYVIREVKQKTVSELSSRARRVLKKGFLIYSLVRPYLNNIAIVEEERQNFIGSTGFVVFSGIKIENEYIKYYLLSDYVKKRYSNMLSGFNSPSITYEQFASTPFPLAPLEEQKKIINFLKNFELSKTSNTNYLENSIENSIKKLNAGQKKAIELKDEFAKQSNYIKQIRQSFIREAMQGKLVKQDTKDGHAKDLLEKIKVYKTKSGQLEKQQLPIKPEEVPFEIPENWMWCRLCDIANDILGGFAFDSTRYSKTETENQIIRLGNVKSNQLVLEAAPVFIDKTYALETEKSKLMHGDILITMTGTRAKKDYLYTLYVTEENIKEKNLFLNQRVGCIRFSPFIFFQYVNYVLKDLRLLEPVFESATGAANQANIGMSALKKILIPLPTINEQNRIVKKLDELMSLCNELQERIQTSRKQNELLLQQVLKEALSQNSY